MKKSSKILVSLIIIIGLASICLAVGIQLVPYGRDHNNPAVVAEPNWDSPQTKELARRACYDCHSNETVWPGYSNIARFPGWFIMTSKKGDLS